MPQKPKERKIAALGEANIAKVVELVDKGTSMCVRCVAKTTLLQIYKKEN